MNSLTRVFSGVLYLLFASTPIVYEEQRGYNSLVGSLPFLAVLLGSITAAGLNLLVRCAID